MEASEAEVDSFILSVWLAEGGEKTDRTVWRGQTTHLSSGERRYVQDLEGITAFVASYLEQMGVPHDSSRP
jgi:hypothetical protein